MKKIILLIFLFSLLACKGENKKAKSEVDCTQSVSSKEQCLSKKVYSYLTELVRSSNFPFSDWDIRPDKVNLLIDSEKDGVISAKLIIDTDGTGTIGWIEYNIKDGKLYNTSVDIESPQVLIYDLKWKEKIDTLVGNASYGNHGLIYLTGITGEFLQATKNGRDGIAIHAGHTVGYSKQITDKGCLMSTFGCLRVYNADIEQIIKIYNEYKNKGYVIYCYVEDVNNINSVFPHYEMIPDPKDNRRTTNPNTQ